MFFCFFVVFCSSSTVKAIKAFIRLSKLLVYGVRTKKFNSQMFQVSNLEEFEFVHKEKVVYKVQKFQLSIQK